VSGVDGELNFQTNIIEGIILRDHVLYYVQELKAPDRYRLDKTPHWFCFCDTSDDHCELCDEILADVDGLRIPHDTPTKMKIDNDLMGYILPATGSIGQLPLVLSGLGLMLISLVCGYAVRRKRERRAEK
jgi:LPXTG-motif cell wall-anchored protein